MLMRISFRDISSLFFILCIVTLGIGSSAAQPSEGDALYCEKRSLGTWFYCETPEPEEPEPAPEIAPPTLPPLTSEEMLLQDAKAFQQAVEDARMLAVYDPTPARVEHYQFMQAQAVYKATMFADHWRRNTRGNPDLDYTTRRPVATYAKQTWMDVRRDEREQVLADLSKEYALVYFFEGTCPYCQRFAPVLKRFSEKYGVHIKAVSVDGLGNQHFPNAERDQGQFTTLLAGQRRVVPAVMLYHRETKAPTWLTFGLVSQEELAERIFVTMARPVGEDY